MIFLAFRPFRALVSFCIQNIVIPIYKIYLLNTKRIKEAWAPSKNRILYPLFSKYIVHGIVIVLTILVTSNNIWTRNVSGETIGKNSVLYAMVSDESEDIIETEQEGTQRLGQNSTESGALVSKNAEETEESPESAATESGALVKANPTETNEAEKKASNQISMYKVKEGETTSQIAEKFGISTATILYANGLRENDIIKPGQELRILPYSGAVHKVTGGQTLSQIAAKYKVNQEKIIESNKLVSADDVTEGQALLIPGALIPRDQIIVSAPETPSSPTKKSRLATVRDIFFNASDTPEDRTGGWRWPATMRRINQYWNWRHHGVDIDADVGNAIYAAQSGTVAAVGWSGGYGNRIVINHGGGSTTLYGHLSAFAVHTGQSVSKGDIIGKAGNTGWSTGPHLHFELTIGGRKVNPLSYIR